MQTKTLGLSIAALAVAATLVASCSRADDNATAAAPAQTEIEATTATVDTQPASATESPATETVAEAVEESAAVVNEATEQVAQDLRLAQATPKPVVESKFKKGTHYQELVPAQPKVSGTEKIEVVEIFWYGCGHCFAFEPYVKRWEANAPADVNFVRMPAIWNAALETHAKAFYTAEILAKSGALKNPGAFHDAFFASIHKERQPLASPRSIKAFFERFGVTAADYDEAAGSFDLDQKIRKAKDLTRRYKVSGVPAIVVNGKYSNISNAIRGYDEYLELIDTLIALER